MSLKQRLEQYRERHEQQERQNKGQQQQQRTIEIFPTQTWGIVDGEIVEVQALVDEPGMSLCALVSKPDVGTVPVSVTDCPIFRNLSQDAVRQLTEGTMSGGSGSSRNR